MNAETPLVQHKLARRKNMLVGLTGVVILAAAGATAYWYLYASHFISTDNAYAGAEVAQITPSVGGTISEVLVVDTQAVHKGDVLVRIDPTDARLALTQAQADLDRAIRRVRSYAANDTALSAQIMAREADEARVAAQLKAAESDFERAQIDLKRREGLVASGSVSGDELTKVRNAYVTAQAQFNAAKAAAAQAHANQKTAQGARDANAALLTGTTEQTNPEVALARARRDQAAVDLDRTVIKAPVDGVVAKRQAQLGQRVQAGMPLLAIVPIDQMHVDANFKEVQLQKVRIGQPVALHADIYGNDIVYRGVVEGFSGGSGAAFAAIPAQNATGNWIKVVQRLPVRIKLEPEQLRAHPLRVGLSMTAQIDTRQGTGRDTVKP
jgi:membrane fusion protein, multidrug efflux system